MRIVIVFLALFIAWYLITKVLTLFDNSFGKRMPTLLSIRSGNENVQVSLQGGAWQHGEIGLKLYSGDAISTKGNGDALLTFFDGSRLRLDQNTDVLIDRSDQYDQGRAYLTINIRSGRVWISTPIQNTYSGSILRTIQTKNFAASLPAATFALLSPSSITVLRATGIGIHLSLPSGTSDMIVGEGQSFSLSDDANKAIALGNDPYDFRDPITPLMLKDEFLASSYALLSQETGMGSEERSTAAVGSELSDLVLSSPSNHMHVTSKTISVSGRVNPRVALVLVNGQNIGIHKDRTFSVDMSLSKDITTSLHIEAQDLQGITLDAIDRTVFNDYVPSVEPVRFKSPVGSGQTLTTNQKEIEITGEAPANTVAILLNDYKLQLFKPGSRTWSYLASTALGNLVQGKNTYTVYAVDGDGNRSPARSIFILFSLTVPTTGTGGTTNEPPLKQNVPILPGSLSVTAPEAGSSTTTAEKEIVLEGTTSAETSSISVNGYTLSLFQPTKTTWNYIASVDLQTMKRGRNVYRIVSRNKDGEILDVLEYTINYKP